MTKKILRRLLVYIFLFIFLATPINGFSLQTEDEEQAPKYIFIVIGDGMGFGHLEISKLFTKVMSGDMSAEPIWTTFPTVATVSAGVDSSQGGSMLSTGTVQGAGPIAVNEDEEPLTTILDIAKENGLSTGVVTTTSITDATPANYLSHSSSRSKFLEIIEGVPDSHVDFIAGGGLDMMFTESDIPDEYLKDCAGNALTQYANENIAWQMEALGYTTFLGMPGAETFLSADTMPEKTLATFARGNSMFYYLRKAPQYAKKVQKTPALFEMTEKAILALENNENGFCMMVEEGAIDDACHAEMAKYIAAEMGELERTLAVIMDFYNEHPDETLIILTADHETGGFTFSEGKVDALSKITEPLPWDSDASGIRDYVYSNMNRASASASIVKNSVQFIEDNTFGNDYDNRLIAAAEITAKAQFELHIRQQHGMHSHQDVPLLTIGAGHEAFSDCEAIADIAHVICDVADWSDTLGTVHE